ncbi:hypothetical protein BDZ97DRAFT_1758673 [Flammula alnicola]|nr:hypothetical protein BDZ97DRAFT_1758673 [Flammula alnicola]
MGRWHRGPSRLLWFIVGAATATWWIKRKDADRRIFGHCKRPPIQASSGPASDHPGAFSGSRSPFSDWEKRQDWQWEQEKEHLAKISRQATDAMADLTESTLESVLSTAEALKAKLAEHRAQREKQQKLIEEQLEEQRRNPPRLV